MEVLPFNISFDSSGKPQKLPIDKFLSLQKCLIRDGYKFEFLQNATNRQSKLKNVSVRDIELDPSESYKWDNEKLKNAVLSLYKDILTKEQFLIWNSLLCSDYFYSNMKPFKRYLPNNTSNYIYIVKNREYRDPESKLKLEMFRNGGKYSMPTNKYLRTYFSYFSELVKYISNGYL